MTTIPIDGRRDAISREYRAMARAEFPVGRGRVIDVLATRGGNVEGCTVEYWNGGYPVRVTYTAADRL